MTYTQCSDKLAEQLSGFTPISVVVCTYNRVSSLRKTLESLGQMLVPPDLTWELIVVDNNSTDDTRVVVGDFTRTSGLNVRYVFEPKQGLSHARNAGVANSTGEIVAFIDDDVLILQQWLRELARTFVQFDCIGVAGRIIPVWDGVTKPDWLATAGPYFLHGPIPDFDCGDEAKEIRSLPVGANMAFRKSAFAKYGFFRPDFGAGASSGTQLGEDFEFCQRLIRAGERLVYSPQAVVFHPAVEKRITKGYYLHFYYDLGRMAIQLEGWPSEAVLYFGVPRYLYRSFLVKCVNWLFAFDKKKRFYCKARVYCVLGYIAEARKVKRDGSLRAQTIQSTRVI
jgi:glucosyl-dolichyl phosphate glucuronosyltransferase